MRHRIGAAICALIAGALVLVGSSEANAESCSGSGWGSDCTVSNSGTQVDIGGSVTRPGTGDAAPSGPTAPEASAPEPDPADCPLNRCGIVYDVVGLPDVTLADLVSFVPARPTLTGEPLGLGVAGMPTNLVATASEQQIAGVLFGYEVVVRFVPVGFRFDYGDGSARTTTSGGAAWSALGQADFTPTSTTHVYTARGTYPVGVSVLYAASVSFGAGWRPVPGTVTATTTGYDVRVVEVRTALVDKTCLENPGGPGC